MTVPCDLLVRGGRIIDPGNDVDGVIDIAIQDGRIIATGDGIAANPKRVLDAAGRYVVPGLIDTQVHVSSKHNGHVGHKMLSRAGVTTALDLAGPIRDVLSTASRFGAGIQIACIDCLRPDENLPRRDASRGEVREAIDRAMVAGAIGVKIHVDSPLTPETNAAVIEEANQKRAYVAQHCGTTATGSDIIGLREAVELAGPNRLHIAHVNSYCRGYIDDPVVEAQEAIALLRSAPHLYSESYLAANNGNWGGCKNGVPQVARVHDTWLPSGGYPGTKEGLRQAIMDGYAWVPLIQGDDTVLAAGAEGVAAWEAAATQTGISFPVNPVGPRVMLATSKDSSGKFDVDALATDGGGIPRNNLADAGLALVGIDGFSLREFVQKTAWTPSRMLGLRDKGHLGEGADADITILEPTTRRVVTTICRGELIMHEGVVFGRGTTVLTTERGAEAVSRSGCRPIVIDVAESGFYSVDGLNA